MNEFDTGVQTALEEFEKNAYEHGVVNALEAIEDLEFDLDDEFDRGLYSGFSKVASMDPEDIEMALFGSSFDLAKEAALQDINGLIEQGADINDIFYAIDETISTDLEKNASEEDVETRLGLESSCFAFLEKAAECAAHGILDPEVILKEASSYGDAMTAPSSYTYDHGLSSGAGDHEAKSSNADQIGRMDKMKNMARSGFEKAKKHKGKIGIAAGTTAAALTAAGLYNHLQSDATKGGGSMGKQSNDEKVSAALERLYESGLLDD